MERNNTKNCNLLMAIEQIVEKAKDSQLSKDYLRKVAKHLKYMSDKLELTKEQCLMLALFINKSDSNRIELSDLGEYAKCSTARLLIYSNDIETLEKREFIRCCRDSRSHKSISYRVPYDVIEAIKHDRKYAPRDNKNLSCQELFGELDSLFELRKDNEMTYEIMKNKIKSLFEDNAHLHFVESVRKLCLQEDDEMLLILFCHLYVNNDDDNIGHFDLDFLYDDKRMWNRVKSDLNRGMQPLFWRDAIEYNNDCGMVDRESFHLTRRFKDECLNEVKQNTKFKESRFCELIKSDKIVEKKLFYGQGIQKQIDDLCNLINESHYREITSRLKESGFRTGFSCLLYGAPGTGKTETVLQLARMTGRDIMQVNISRIKSCWVGESEKNIKSLFDAYRSRVNNDDITPILLFNEADAIINKRMEDVQSSANKMENAIQNIILQEMENFDGILIATTNLAQNMDKAFERRFLYKIKFEKPTIEARMHIWHEMIPSLCETDAKTLAERYDFSGGQIENIARHNAINNILYGDTGNTIDVLMSYCENERLERKELRRIGFVGNN